MKIDRFDPKNIEQTQALTKKYCMPMDKKNFIKWRGLVRRSKKNGGSVTIAIDTRHYLEQICGFYRKKNHKGFTLEDIATICQLRYMAARRSLKNAKINQARLPDFAAVVVCLNKIISESEDLYYSAMAEIDERYFRAEAEREACMGE